MKNRRGSSDSERSSEFNTEDEDIEYGLYAKLYFDPNPDITENYNNISCKQWQNDKDDTNTCKEYKKGMFSLDKSSNREKSFLQLELTKSKHSDDPQHTLAKMGPQPSDNVSTSRSKGYSNSHYEMKNYDVLSLNNAELCKTESHFYRDTSSANNQAVSQKLEKHTVKLDAYLPLEMCCDDDPVVRKNAVPSQAGRERLSSVCSDGSIPGSVPLDSLYCNSLPSGDGDDDGNCGIKSKVMMKKLEPVEQASENKKKYIERESIKRKIVEINISSDDEAEDSRCSSLIGASSKNILGQTESYIATEESNSEDDVYILPPPIKHCEVLTLDSDSDKVDPIDTEKVYKIKKNNKYMKIEQETHQSLPSVETFNTEERMVRKRGDMKMTDSDTDSNADITLPEATKGTDLTLNIDSSLSGLVKKITRDEHQIRKPKKMSNNPQTQKHKLSIDSSLGRPDTLKEPSCDKWTQEMASFYDSDVPYDFDVSKIHSQQSGTQADWHLIAADYQIIKRMRYYNALERCTLCRQFGHTRNQCSHVPHCHICSETDHTGRGNCPENCCFKCGGQPHFFCPDTETSVCSLCGFPGHFKEICPDLWRRFHLTTRGLIAQAPARPLLVPVNKQYCYSCAKRGHYGHQCPLKFQNRAYSQVPQSIVSYGSPVNLVDGYFTVNIDRVQPTKENVMRIQIKKKDFGRIIGRNGAIIKEIKRKSGAHVQVVREGKPEVFINGPSEACLQAQDMVHVLLGHKKVDGYEEFMKYVENVNQNSTTPSLLVKSGNNQELSWSENFLVHLDRQKGSVLKKVKGTMKKLMSSNMNIDHSIKKLKQFKKSNGRKMGKNTREHFNRVSKKLLGQEKYGEGLAVHSRINTLMENVKTCSSRIIPEELCVEVAKTLGLLHEPPVEKLQEILEQAFKYSRSAKRNKRNKKSKKKLSAQNSGEAAQNITQNQNLGKKASKPKHNRKNTMKKGLNKAQNSLSSEIQENIVTPLNNVTKHSAKFKAKKNVRQQNFKVKNKKKCKMNRNNSVEKEMFMQMRLSVT